jgi:hypothetical protein
MSTTLSPSPTVAASHFAAAKTAMVCFDHNLGNSANIPESFGKPSILNARFLADLTGASSSPSPSNPRLSSPLFWFCQRLYSTIKK